MQRSTRSPAYFAMSVIFGLFVLFLYGPMIAIIVLSFQGPDGGLTLSYERRLHSIIPANYSRNSGLAISRGSFLRSICMALIVMILTVVISLSAGLAYRKPFRFAGTIFYITVASLIVPSILITLGIGLMFDRLGLDAGWYIRHGGASNLDLALRPIDHVRDIQPLR